MDLRKRTYEIIEVAEDDDIVSHIYDISMILIIIASIIPLAMRPVPKGWDVVESLCVWAFIIDYFLRLMTADYKLNDYSALAFIKYPFTPMAIIDLLSILPHFILLNSGFGLLRLVRLSRALRVVRIFRMFRYSDNFDIIIAVIKRSKDSLVAVGSLTVAYIITSALVIFNVEPESFKDFFDAVYWATISLTTIGYGDITTTSTIGRVVTMLSAFFGIAVIALPAGIITAGYMQEIQEQKIKHRRRKANNEQAEE